MKRYSKGEMAKTILLLAVAGGVVATVCVLPGLSVILKYVDATSSKDRYRVQRSIASLKKRGLLTHAVIKGKPELVLTEVGKSKAWSYLKEDMKISRPKKWDGRWRLLMFDIPETRSKIRQEVSFKIKDIGMRAIQNSVFICPFPCKKEIETIMDHYDVKRYCVYVEADSIEGRTDLMRVFGL